MTPEAFKVEVPDGVLADLRDRLTRTRWAADYGNDSWRYGVNGDWLRSVVGYWLDQYDWRAQEAAINAFPQYRVRLDGIPTVDATMSSEPSMGTPDWMSVAKVREKREIATFRNSGPKTGA